jgi:hypothetical protein
MNTKSVRRHTPTRSAVKAKPKKPRVHAEHAPSAELVASRLAALDLTSIPWFREDIDLTPPDGGPEVFGPPVYRAPRRRS